MVKKASGKRVMFYARVSTNDQHVENQLLELEQAARSHGWEVVGILKDEGISGAKGRGQRPGYDKLCKGIIRRDFDIVASWSADRLSRSTLDLCELLELLCEKKVDLYLHKEAVDTRTIIGKAMFQISAVFAELERGRIKERILLGVERARAEGKKIGRPKVSNDVETAILKVRKQGMGIRKIAREVGCGVAVVQRVLKENVGSA